MNASHRAVLVLFAFVTAAAVAGPAASAEHRVLVLDPVASKVSFVLEATGHDVAGGLAVRSGAVTFDPATGAASGEIAIDLTTAATGNTSRDKTMHREVLEDATWPLAVFRAKRLRGDLAPEGVSQVTLDGTLSFHGAEHELSLPAKVEVHAGRLEAETSFPIPFVEWGLHDPSIAFLRVAKVVSVKVEAQGRLEAPGAAAAGGTR